MLEFLYFIFVISSTMLFDSDFSNTVSTVIDCSVSDNIGIDWLTYDWEDNCFHVL
jgi:hypothetical protein